jgi:catechol 1,2-dioxygenase
MRPTLEGKGLALPNSNKLRLRPDAQPSESNSDDSEFGSHHRLADIPQVSFDASPEAHLLGSSFRPDAPFRAKISPPNEPGRILVIKGRVWGFDTKEPLGRAKMDIWHANAVGRYDYEDLTGQAQQGDFINRARLYCDQNGYYEFETIHPGAYQTSLAVWRAPHIHFRVRYVGYTTLVTQLFFKGDPYQNVDPYIKSSLITDLQEKQSNGLGYEEGVFDIVLTPSEI